VAEGRPAKYFRKVEIESGSAVGVVFPCAEATSLTATSMRRPFDGELGGVDGLAKNSCARTVRGRVAGWYRAFVATVFLAFHHQSLAMDVAVKRSSLCAGEDDADGAYHFDLTFLNTSPVCPSATVQPAS